MCLSEHTNSLSVPWTTVSDSRRVHCGHASIQSMCREVHTPITINGAAVERVSSFRFLGVHLAEDLTWSVHTNKTVKKAQQRLFFLRRLKRFGMSPHILRTFYHCAIESILTGCITTWYGNSTAYNCKALQRVVRCSERIIGGELPSLQDIYRKRCLRKAGRIIKDSSHPSHQLFRLLPSGRRFCSIRSRTSRLRDSFFHQTAEHFIDTSPSLLELQHYALHTVYKCHLFC
uniref:Alkylated DNA repair protein AlkB homologue 8 N-terminal domain-containing protein n=1 Tax=Astatotilapia calliptera TaxID=8154 RepID=A0AAX7TT88_ASTCA